MDASIMNASSAYSAPAFYPETVASKLPNGRSLQFKLGPKDDNSGGVLSYLAAATGPGPGPFKHVVVVVGAAPTIPDGRGTYRSKIAIGLRCVAEHYAEYGEQDMGFAVIDFCSSALRDAYDKDKNLVNRPPPHAEHYLATTVVHHADSIAQHLAHQGTAFLVCSAAWVRPDGLLGAGPQQLVRLLKARGVNVVECRQVPYPARSEGGVAAWVGSVLSSSGTGLGLSPDQLLVLGVPTPHIKEMQQAEERARRSAGGTATMNGPHAFRISSEGGKASRGAGPGRPIKSVDGLSAKEIDKRERNRECKRRSKARKEACKKADAQQQKLKL